MEKTLEKITNVEETKITDAAEQLQPEEKPYTFRRLSTADIFPTLKVLNKLGLKDMKEDEGIKKVILQFTGATVKGKADPTKLGIDMFLELACLIVDNLPKCEAELIALLSQTSNLSVEEIREQDMAVTFEMIVDFIKKEEFGDFFKVVLRLFK